MCGTFAYLGKNPLSVRALEGLKPLEYRGYDSAGVAIVDPAQGVLVFKALGDLSHLSTLLENTVLQGSVIIGHTRWATHGEVSYKNTHPHVDQNNQIAVVHNGMIDNSARLRRHLEARGYFFYSETDTEVVAQLIGSFYRGNLVEAVCEALTCLEGFWGLLVVHAAHPELVVAVANGSPLVVGSRPDKEEIFIASDIKAFVHSPLEICFLEPGELVVLSRQEITFMNRSAGMEKKWEELESRKILWASPPAKEQTAYANYMIKEIYEQPRVISSILDRRICAYGNAQSPERFLFPEISLGFLDKIQASARVLFLGAGSSLHAATLAAHYWSAWTKLKVHAEVASEYLDNPKDQLIVAVSQSGETRDLLVAVRAARRRGASIIGLCNAPHSSLAREADIVLPLEAGEEVSVCATKSFSAQLVLLLLLGLAVAVRRAALPTEVVEQYLREFLGFPAAVEDLLNRSLEVKEMAGRLSSSRALLLLGKAALHLAGREVALKLQEAVRLFAMALPAGEIKHGPLALVDSDVAVLGFCQDASSKTWGNLLEARVRGAHIATLAFEEGPNWLPAEHQMILTARFEPAQPLLSVLFGQLLTYYWANMRGFDVDRPRHLAKSVTVD